MSNDKTNIRAVDLQYDLEEKIADLEDLLVQIPNPNNTRRGNIEKCIDSLRESIEPLNETDMMRAYEQHQKQL